DTPTASTLAQFKRLTTALIGVGAWEGGHPAIAQALSASDVNKLESAGVVGHSLPIFFAGEGQVVDAGTAERAIGITPVELRAVPRRICVAGGRTKALALEAVLNSGLVTHLVTDAPAAEAMASSLP
ncbi:MAG TPA: hypothetical protein ENH15_02515, partial [Actinobacteria bacterium]|nr:hypothetical protein [Actinomycetota bacterium]